LLDGQAVKSCTLLADPGRWLPRYTIEGLPLMASCIPCRKGSAAPRVAVRLLHSRHDLAGVQLLERNPKPTREEIAHGLEGNLCRCTGYSHIIDAIEWAAAAMRKRSR